MLLSVRLTSVFLFGWLDCETEASHMIHRHDTKSGGSCVIIDSPIEHILMYSNLTS